MSKKSEGYKKAYYRRIPCWFRPYDFELMGRNVFWDALLEIVVFWDTWIIPVEEYPIMVEDD